MGTKLTKEQFTERANTVHSNKYNYDKVDYKTNKIKVTITCPDHQDFNQLPGQHLLGSGCPKCAREAVGEKLKKTNASSTASFIEKATLVHKGLFTYENATYTNNKTKLAITCPIHGDFKQTPNDHLDGCGCPKCAHKKRNSLWTYTEWEKAGKTALSFTSYQLYVIKCYDDKETFIKIGKTFKDLNIRFLGKSRMPYEWEPLIVISDEARKISVLEKMLHSKFSSSLYTPNKPFGGATECFTIQTAQTILNTLKGKK